MNLPSRGERESATTTRYTGFFFDPTRVNLMRTAKPLPPCLGSLLAFVGFRRLALRRLRRRRGTRQLWKLAAAHALHELVEAELALHQPGLHLRLLVRLDSLFRALDEREDVAHAEDARRHPVGMEVLELVDLLADGDQLDRPAGDRLHGQRCPAARV